MIDESHELAISDLGDKVLIENIPAEMQVPFFPSSRLVRVPPQDTPKSGDETTSVALFAVPESMKSFLGSSPDFESGILADDKARLIDLYQKTLTDYKEHWKLRERIRQRLLGTRLIGDLQEKIVSIEYSGYCDSGGVQSSSFSEGDLPEGETSYEEFLGDLVYQTHPGYENNDGAQGDVTWDLEEDKIVIEHGQNVTTVNSMTSTH